MNCSRKMMADKDIMELILSMQSDPDVQALLSDPAVMEAVQAGDLGCTGEKSQAPEAPHKEQVREIGKRL